MWVAMYGLRPVGSERRSGEKVRVIEAVLSYLERIDERALGDNDKFNLRTARSLLSGELELEARWSKDTARAVREEQISNLSGEQIDLMKTMHTVGKVMQNVWPYGMLFPNKRGLCSVEELERLGFIQELSLEVDEVHGARCFRLTCCGQYILGLIKNEPL